MSINRTFCLSNVQHGAKSFMKKKKTRKKANRHYTPEFCLKLVKVHFEERYERKLIAEEFGCGRSTLMHVLNDIKEYGEAGLFIYNQQKNNRLTTETTSYKRKLLNPKNKIKVVGGKRITNLLYRWFFIKTSHATVRKKGKIMSKY